MSTVRILDENYAFLHNVSITASSENSQYPASNAGLEIRGKSWRSDGYYVIGATNKYIDYRESGNGSNGTTASNATGGGSIAGSPATGTWRGQTFTTTSAIELTDVDFNLRQTGAVSGNATVRIYSDSAGTPSALLATSDLVDVSVLTGAFATTNFNFSSTTCLADSTVYHALVDVSGVTFGGNIIQWEGASGDPYGGGDLVFTNNSGGAWGSVVGDDCVFSVQGDVLAAELTATLTEGNYSTTELIAEIKLQMEASSANARTYTASRGSDGKWTILGEVFLSLFWATGTNSANTLAGTIGFDGSIDNVGSVSYTGALVALHTEEWLQIDIKTAEEIDSLALLFDPFEGLKFSESAVVRLQASATTAFVSPAVDVLLTIDNQYNLVSHFFTAAQEYRYWRVKIVDPQNANLYVELGTVFLSKATQLTQQPEIGFTFQLKDPSKVSKTDFGNEYVDSLPQRKSMSFNYKALSDDDIKTLEDVYLRVGTKTPVVLVLDNEEVLFSQNRFFVYGRFSSGFSEKNVFYNFFDSDLSIQETF